jgi:gamma-glutamylcyclotransferase (GGCT)/AIG2-like uncharacterized protein YtfP
LSNVTPIIEFPLKLFVYGTLKKSYALHDYMKGCTFVKNATAFGILLHLGGFPGFLPETTGMSVSGELWEVPDMETLAQLDKVEGHPHHFTRQKVMIAGSETVWTYVYSHYYGIMKSGLKTKFDLINNGHWSGASTMKTEFLGFYVDAPPPKADYPAVAHFKFTGNFAGLIDCQTGMIYKGNWKADGKPHLTYNLTTKEWEVVPEDGRTINGETVNSSLTVKALPAPVVVVKKDDHVPYIDPCDPGEVDAPLRPFVEVKK